MPVRTPRGRAFTFPRFLRQQFRWSALRCLCSLYKSAEFGFFLMEHVGALFEGAVRKGAIPRTLGIFYGHRNGRQTTFIKSLFVCGLAA
jgi:hypothetical protein